MATATITRFTITRDTANADVELDYTVNYDEFDVESNIGYHETYKLIGDDTNQDGDDGAPGDNQVGVTFFFVSPQRANDRPASSATRTWTLPWATSTRTPPSGRPTTTRSAPSSRSSRSCR